jgi:hypothetical protein
MVLLLLASYSHVRSQGRSCQDRTSCNDKRRHRSGHCYCCGCCSHYHRLQHNGCVQGLPDCLPMLLLLLLLLAGLLMPDTAA